MSPLRKICFCQLLSYLSRGFMPSVLGICTKSSRDVNQPKSKAKFSLAPDTSAGQSAQLNPWDDSAASAFFTELSFFGADDQKDADAICVETRSYIHRYM